MEREYQGGVRGEGGVNDGGCKGGVGGGGGDAVETTIAI